MARKKSETPTDWELFLMKQLWRLEEATVDQVRETLRKQDIKRSESALRTTLQTMTKKGLVKAKKKENATHYTATVQRNPMEKRIFSHLINTLFEGNRENFVLSALNQTDATPEILQTLKKKLENAKKNKSQESDIENKP